MKVGTATSVMAGSSMACPRLFYGHPVGRRGVHRRSNAGLIELEFVAKYMKLHAITSFSDKLIFGCGFGYVGKNRTGSLCDI